MGLFNQQEQKTARHQASMKRDVSVARIQANCNVSVARAHADSRIRIAEIQKSVAEMHRQYDILQSVVHHVQNLQFLLIKSKIDSLDRLETETIASIRSGNVKMAELLTMRLESLRNSLSQDIHYITAQATNQIQQQYSVPIGLQAQQHNVRLLPFQ